MPTLSDRLKLWLWTFATLVSSTSALVYLTLSTRPELAPMTERPWGFTVLFWASVLASTGIWAAASGRAWRHVRPLMHGGVVAGWLVTGFYTFYVYHLSQTLSPAAGAVEVGELAPDFAVTDPTGRTWTLSEFRGRTVLLVFYRGDW